MTVFLSAKTIKLTPDIFTAWIVPQYSLKDANTKSSWLIQPCALKTKNEVHVNQPLYATLKANISKPS